MNRQDSVHEVPVNAFLILYGLAWAGCSVAYVPFLTILLPLQVMDLAGPAKIDWLAYLAFAGAIAASLGNIAAGWLSDLTRNRRSWIAMGMLSCCGLLIAFRWADSFAELLLLILIWQLGLNLMMAPLAAWAGDCVPDDRKGVLGGLMSAAPALGAVAGFVIMIPGFVAPNARLTVVAVLTTICVTPLLILSFLRPFQMSRNDSATSSAAPPVPARRAIMSMWVARLLIQITEATLFAFLYYWLQSIDADVKPDFSAFLFGLALIIAIPMTYFAGRQSDRNGKPLIPLKAATTIITVALLVMAWAPDITAAFFGYVVFGIAASMFLALHAAQTLRLLPKSNRRGRDLGLFNLTNTIPSLIMPWLTVMLVPLFGFTGLFMLLAALSLIAGMLLLFAQP